MDGLPDWAIDDSSIVGERWLLRRIPQGRVQDGIPEKSNFREDEPAHGLSVTVWDSPQDLEDIRRGHEEFAVICVPASAFRAEPEVVIARAPLDGNVNHCEVFPHFGQKAQKRIRNMFRWVHRPTWLPADPTIEIFDPYANAIPDGARPAEPSS